MNRYLNAIEAALRRKRPPRHEIDAIVAEHRSLLDDLLAEKLDLVDELGTPEDYAAEVAAETPRQEPQLFGFIPVNPLGAFSKESRSRMWNPQDPRIFQPHQLGIGWSINWGAVAVKLGLIQPDDIDQDVIASIPTPALRAAQALPLAITAAQALLLVKHSPALPEQIHTKWAFDGTPKSRKVSKDVLAINASVTGALSGLALIPAMRGDREDSLMAASLATVIAGVTTGQLAATIAEANGDKRAGNTAVGALLTAVGASITVIVAPLLAGLRAVWRREGVA